MENVAKGDRVRLAGRTVIDRVMENVTDDDGNKIVSTKTVPGRGLERVGRVEKLTRALSGDGRREVINCHVRFPAVEVKGSKYPEVVEVHEAGTLEEVEIAAPAPDKQAGFAALSLILALAGAAAIAIVGVWLMPDVASLMLAVGPAVAPSRDSFVRWARKREPMKNFNNVGAGTAANPQTAYSTIPWHPRTVLGFFLEMGGTTFSETHIPRIEMFLGETSVFGPINADDLRMTERYVHGAKESGYDGGDDTYFLPLDFTHANVKEIGGEQIGGIDLVQLRGLAGRDVSLRLEVDIGAAIAPQLRGEVAWGAPQGGSDLGRLMRKLIKRTYPQQPAGDWYPEIDVRGAILARQYFKGTVYNNAVVTTFTAANHGLVNTGNGAISATVTSLTPAGRYTIQCVEPGVNVGTFQVFDPKGNNIGTVIAGGGATAIPNGPTITVADGAADFIVGDGAFVDVLPNNTDGNINVVEIAKNEDKWFFMRDRVARMLGQRYGRTPMAGLFVADYLLDNHGDGVIDTADAAVLDYRVNLTAQDTPFIIHEVLAAPTYLARQRNA